MHPVFTMPAGGSTRLEFMLNGAPARVETREGESLVETLRTRCGIRSIKDGCQPQGQCGACLVLVDGHAKVSCAMPAASIAGREITTLDGIADDERRTLARCFVSAAGLQCGFCIPGIALRAHHLVRKNPTPSRTDIVRAIDAHLCRCTGYVKIVDAIDLFARAMRGEAAPEITTAGGVGARLARVDGEALASGRKAFIDDMTLPGMLHGALVLSPHPRARVVHVDSRRATALPGVAAVATASDVPGDRWVGLLHSDWPILIAPGEETRYTGDVIAAVAAEDEATAREAASLIHVDYEILEPVLDADDALRDGAPRVNPRHDNLLSRTTIVRGDAEDALARSARIVSGCWQTQRIEHLFLEPESCVAAPLPEGRLLVFSSGQGVFDDRRQIASILGVPVTDVEVKQIPSGGAFGGKEDLSIQGQTALLAAMTGRPVKLTLNREESVRIHPKRHPIRMTYTAGCDEDGRLTAVKARIVGDSGAYASVGAKVLERAAGHACGAYHVPNVDIEALAVYTNNPPSGAMRGFGVNQTNFAIEGCVDFLAKLAGIDPWEMRWRNALDAGRTFTTGQILDKPAGLKKTLMAVREHYYAARERGRATGIACGVKNAGLGNGVREYGRAKLVVEGGGIVSLYNGYSEFGQGLLTVLTQIAAEVTGLAASAFRPRVDTRHPLDCGQTTGSRATLLGGRAVIAAAEKLRRDLLTHSLDELAGRTYDGEVVIDDTTTIDAPHVKTHTSFGFATQLCILDEEGRIEKIVAAHDVGRAINPAFCEGQIEGAVHMGLGYALTEELPCPNGMPATFKLMELGALRASDMPPVEVILVEEPEPEGPFGAKGLGEIGLVPTAAAVAGALEAFDGIRRATLPMRDSTAARAMRAGRKIWSAAATPLLRSAAATALRHGRGRQSGGTAAARQNVNAHTHLYSGLTRFGMPKPEREPESFLEILQSIWWRLDRALDERSLRAAARLYVAEARLLGTVALIDHHESPEFIEGSLDVIADVCQELGMRALLCYGATERNGGRAEAKRGLAECRRFILTNRRPLVRGAVGLHAAFTVSSETIREAGALCRDLGVPLHVHVAEDQIDGDGFHRLLRAGALLPGSILAHGVWLDRRQVQQAAIAGVWLVQNPRSNRGNGVGYASALGATGRIALGTDGFPSDMRAEAESLRQFENDDFIAARLDASGMLGRAIFGDDLAPGEVHFDIGRIQEDAQREAERLWSRMRGIDESRFAGIRSR